MSLLILAILVSGFIFYFFSEKYKNKRKLIFLFIQPLIVLILFGSYYATYKLYEVNDVIQSAESIEETSSIEITPTKDKFNFISGEDFPEGRYIIKSKENKGIIFIRNTDGEKIVSVTLNNNDYEATFTEGMVLAVLDVDSVEIIPVQNEIKTEFTPGIWVIGQDVVIESATYSIKNVGDVVTIITDKNNNEKIRINSEEEKVNLEQGDMIRVLGDGYTVIK